MNRVSIVSVGPWFYWQMGAAWFEFKFELGLSYFFLKTESGEDLDAQFGTYAEAEMWARSRGYELIGVD